MPNKVYYEFVSKIIPFMEVTGVAVNSFFIAKGNKTIDACTISLSIPGAGHGCVFSQRLCVHDIGNIPKTLQISLSDICQKCLLFSFFMYWLGFRWIVQLTLQTSLVIHCFKTHYININCLLILFSPIWVIQCHPQMHLSQHLYHHGLFSKPAEPSHRFQKMCH